LTKNICSQGKNVYVFKNNFIPEGFAEARRIFKPHRRPDVKNEELDGPAVSAIAKLKVRQPSDV
jgi:hypothetical protein